MQDMPEKMDNTFIHNLKSIKLTAKEQELAEFILKNSQDFIHMAIAEAADACGISEATLVRFSKKLGYKGFQALKIQLAQETTDQKEYLFQDICEEDNTADIARKVFFSYRDTLDATLDVLQPEMIEAAASYIKKAKRLFFFAAGGSQVVASDAANKFLRYGIMSYCSPDFNTQRMMAAVLTEGDVVIAISHSGASTSTIETLIMAKEKGAKTISITNFSRSPILKYSDITLYTSSKETKYQFESLASRIAQLTILDTILNVVVMSDYPYYAKMLKQTRKSLDGTKI